MKIAYISAGAAGMYCGTCMHDNTLASALMEKGHEVSLIPTYTPPRTDEKSVADERIFFGALNVYLQMKMPIFRKTPWVLDRLLDHPKLLAWISKIGNSASTDARMLGEMTVSMLEGESGPQAKELEKLVRFLEAIIQPEVVHLSHTLFAGFARQLRERLGVPVFCSLAGEDLFFDDLVEPYRSKAFEEVRKRAEDIDAFTSPNHYSSDLMAANYGLPRDRMYPARLGIRLEDFRPSHAQAPSNGDDGPLHLGYLARFCPEKGTHLLLEAFRILAERHPADRLRLRIAGFLSEKDRKYFDEQRQRVQQWGLEDRVDFVGEVDRQGKVDFLSSLDVFSVPTVYKETKGVFVPEALAGGVPLVLPGHGAFPEWIERAGGGLLFEPGSVESLAETIDTLLQDADKRRELGRAGQESTEKDFGHEVMADEMLELYQRAIDGELRAPGSAG